MTNRNHPNNGPLSDVHTIAKPDDLDRNQPTLSLKHPFVRTVIIHPTTDASANVGAKSVDLQIHLIADLDQVKAWTARDRLTKIKSRQFFPCSLLCNIVLTLVKIGASQRIRIGATYKDVGVAKNFACIPRGDVDVPPRYVPFLRSSLRRLKSATNIGEC